MNSEWRDRQAGNGLNQQSSNDAATFSKACPRKGSYTSNINDKVARAPNFQSRWPPATNKTQFSDRGSYYKKSSFQEDSSESEYQRVEKLSPDSESPAIRSVFKDENYSTSSSYGGNKASYSKIDILIDNFKVVVMGNEFDGIKVKGQPNDRFAAACLFKSPEANELALPDF